MDQDLQRRLEEQLVELEAQNIEIQRAVNRNIIRVEELRNHEGDLHQRLQDMNQHNLFGGPNDPLNMAIQDFRAARQQQPQPPPPPRQAPVVDEREMFARQLERFLYDITEIDHALAYEERRRLIEARERENPLPPPPYPVLPPPPRDFLWPPPPIEFNLDEDRRHLERMLRGIEGFMPAWMDDFNGGPI